MEILLGDRLVPDFLNPRAEDVDLAFMRGRLRAIRRFSGHPAALSVWEHQRLVAHLAAIGHAHARVILWALHHDDHEYATGDIVTPVKMVLGRGLIEAVQARWDLAICDALGLPVPSAGDRAEVDHYDRLALALEWRWLIGRDVAELGLSEDIVALSGRRELIAGFAP